MNEEIFNKTKQTNKQKYDNGIYLKTQNFKDKSKQTCIKKYGVEYYSQTNISKKRYFNKISNELSNNYILLKFLNKFLSIKHKTCGKNFIIHRESYRTRIKRNHEICTICNPINKNWSVAEHRLFLYIKSIYNNIIIRNTFKIIC